MKFLYIFLLIVFNSFLIAENEFKFIGNLIDYKVEGNILKVRAENAILNISAISDNIIRIRYSQKKEFSDKRSYAIEKELSPIKFDLDEEKEFIIFKTNFLRVYIKKNPITLTFKNNEGFEINSDYENLGFAYDNDEVRCFKKLNNNENFYGLGEKTGDLNRRGKQFILWNTDHPAFDWRWDPLYVSIPFFLGVKENISYGIFFDNTYKSTFNFGASSEKFYWFGAEKGEMDYYFIYGPEIKKVVQGYAELTGRIELPPKWALGFQQSKWSYYPDTEVLELAKKFRRKQIPIDVIYLDIHYMDEYRVFSWDKKRFPNPKRMLEELADIGIKIIPIIDPGVKADDNYEIAKEGIRRNVFAKYPDGSLYRGEVWPSWSYFPDFTMKECREWWGENLKKMIDLGCAGFWNDMNEPAVWGQNFPDIVLFNDYGFGSNHKKIHNVYALEMAKANFEAYKKFFPNKRFFTLSRAGFAGIQKYAAIWTGDNVANDEHLRLANLMCQGMGLSGLPFVGSDVGGFIGYPSGRLYIRWLQLGAFTPFFRAHSAINEPDKEPWAFGEEIERIARDVINLRYKLIPHLYNEFYKTSISGLPIMRPMIMEYQNDERSYGWDTQYQFFVGENLLVAPIMNEKEDFKKVYLPEGKWYDINRKQVLEGQKDYLMEVPLDQVPHFLRDGGILILGEKQNFIDEKKSISIYLFSLDKDIKDSIYNDDGLTINTNDTFNKLYIKTQKKKDELLINLDFLRENNKFFDVKNLILLETSKPKKILINDVNELKENDKNLENSFNYDNKEKSLYLNVSLKNKIKIKIVY